MQGIHLIEWYHEINVPLRQGVPGAVQDAMAIRSHPYPDRQHGKRLHCDPQDVAGRRARRQDDVAAVIKALRTRLTRLPQRDPLTIQTDHKFLWASYVVRSKRPNEMKDQANSVEVLRWAPGKDTARTREENPINPRTLSRLHSAQAAREGMVPPPPAVSECGAIRSPTRHDPRGEIRIGCLK